ncbi:hypothetical protein M8818_002445 [Zalaria obscura]|uniref:Uncharacterized protein n=1 Tax=Zalaria obscura TaxID=2024903 RepID=A0ACC3SIT9_9PEZI
MQGLRASQKQGITAALPMQSSTNMPWENQTDYICQGPPMMALPNIDGVIRPGRDANFWDWQQWPCEISDSMMWSSQFVPLPDSTALADL